MHLSFLGENDSSWNFVYIWAPIPYLNFRHVKSGGKGHRILGSKFSFMRSPIAIHTHLADLQLNLKKETDIDFIACPAFYTICYANGNCQHLALQGLSERMAKVKRFLWALDFTKS